jgi:hypothetical protein
VKILRHKKGTSLTTEAALVSAVVTAVASPTPTPQPKEAACRSRYREEVMPEQDA